jgi:hypothetical protein
MGDIAVVGVELIELDLRTNVHDIDELRFEVSPASSALLDPIRDRLGATAFTDAPDQDLQPNWLHWCHIQLPQNPRRLPNFDQVTVGVTQEAALIARSSAVSS